MRTLVSRVARLGIVGLLILPSGAAGQANGWHLHGEVAASQVMGGARSASLEEERITLRPHRPTTYGIRLERVGQRFGIGLAVRYARPALGFEGSDIGIIDRANGFTLFELAPEASLPVARHVSGATVRVRAGPVLDIWSWEVGETQVRLGGRGAVGLDLPIGSRVAATIGAAATLTGSMFAEADVAPEFERRTAIRTEVGLGLRYALR